MTFQIINVFKPQLIEEYLVFNQNVKSSPIGIADMESFSLQEETLAPILPKKLSLKDRNHQVFFHPSELIRVDIHEGISTLYLINNQQLSIRVSLEEIWQLFEQYNISKSFWKNPSNILNLSHVISMKSENVSKSPKEEDINIRRKNDYRSVITFSDQDTLTLRKTYKTKLEVALNDYFSNLD